MPTTAPTTPVTQPPPPAPHLPSGPLARYLAHPGPTTARLLHHVAHVLAHVAVTAGPVALGVAVATLVALSAAWAAQGRRMARGARLIEVLAPPVVDPEGAATLWTNLVALLRPAWRRVLFGQPHLGFELVASDAGLTISLWVPGGIPPGLVERAVEAAWPGARTETRAATPPLTGPGVATGGALTLAAGEQYMLRTEHKVDPLRPLLGALAALGEGECACVQVLARPVTGRRLTHLHKSATARRAGRPATRTARLLDLLTPGPATKPAAVDPTRAADVADILDKAAQPCWAIAVRYAVATTATDRQAKARLRGRAHAVATAFALFSGRNRLERHRLAHPARVLAARRLGKGNLVSVAELAALAHLPTDVAVPGLARAGANAVPPPPAVACPAAGGVTGPDTSRKTSTPKVLGDAQAGGRRPVRLAVADARYHLHVMGATGSGKSTLLTNLALTDIEAGRGLVVVDPKGDLVTDLLDRLPDGAEARTVLIDPEDPDAAPVLNVLSGPDPDLAVDNLVGIFRSIFAAFWGPRTDDVLRSACLTLLRHAAATGTSTSLADVPRLLSDDEFRKPRVAVVSADSVGLGGFWKAYEQMSEANRAQVVGPVMNKLRAFLLRDFVRSVVGRPDSSFDMGQVLDGGICLVRVPKGILGEETARLLGSFVVAKVWQTATHRARLGQAARVDASLVVDEAQNFLHLPRSFDEMLAEARGYRLSMVLAHQHLGQLPKELREAVSANARTKVWFSMSPEDAHALSRHVAPEVSEHDLSHLGAYTAAARLVVGGEETPAFTLRTRPAPPPQPGRAEAVRTANRAAHHRPRPEGAKPLAGRTLPAGTRTATVNDTSTTAGAGEMVTAIAAARGDAGAPSGIPADGPSDARSDVRSGLHHGLHEGLQHGLRPRMEPSGPSEPPPHGTGEGSAASADSRGRWV
ncbi:MAG: type IV secretion system DNA-binding domain-containing protein [Actinomycetota bacterium]|nr:type IV secretion system DNA-binding domain-containing protein [Actinomycetota bacterium]